MSHADDVLEHHGVKGMHWGVRKGTQRAGAVARQSRINANDRFIAKNQKMATRKILPAPKTAARNIKKLEKSNARLKAGHVHVVDILDRHSVILIKDIRKAVNDTKQ